MGISRTRNSQDADDCMFHSTAQERCRNKHSWSVVPITFCCLELIDELAPIGKELLGHAAAQDTGAPQSALSLACNVVKRDFAHG